MSIRLASPRIALRNRMEAPEARAACRLPANDNAAIQVDNSDLRAALQHFARHGLAAASHAREQAEQARATGDEQGWEYWRDVCSTLDRRMGRQLDQPAQAS